MREKLINVALLLAGAIVGVVALSRSVASQQPMIVFGTFNGAPKALALTTDGYVQSSVAGGGVPFTSVTGGTSTRIPYFAVGGALTSSAGLTLGTTGAFDVIGQTSSPTSGGIRSTINYPGEGFIRAAFIAKRNSTTPVNGDGVEYLVQNQDSAGNYANVGGFVARILDVTPAVATGRLELAVKPAGAFNTTFDITQMVINHNGNVGMGYYFGNTTLAAAPQALLHLARDGNDPAGAGTVLEIERASADTGAPNLSLRKARGTIGTPGQTLTNDSLGSITWHGWQTSTNGYISAAAIQVTATNDYAATRGSLMNFNVVPTGAAAQINAAQVTQAGFTAAGTAPTVGNVGANSCGTTTATIGGANQSGEITVGATSGSRCRVTTSQPAPVAWNGACGNNATNAVCTFQGIDTTHFDLVGTFGAGNILTYIAIPR